MRNTPSHGKSAAPLRDDVRHMRALLVEFSRRASLRDPLAAMCEEAQLTPPQIHGVMWLGQDGPLTMGELAARLGVTEKTITGLVDRLESAGYLARERDASDRRVVRARLTERGQAARAEIDRHVDAKLGALLGLLDAADRRDLFRILEKLAALPAAPSAPHARKP